MFSKAQDAIEKLIAAVEALSIKVNAQSEVLADMSARLRALEKVPPVPAPAPPAPGPAPGPAPEPPATPSTRSRAEVQRILLEEFAKQTSFLPGGANGSATPAEVNDPKRAIQMWVSDLIDNYSAATLPDAELRALLVTRIAAEVKKYGWDRNYPPASQHMVVSGESSTKLA